MNIGFITDNHMHIDPLNGEGLLAAKKFKRAGGTTIFLVNKTSKDLGVAVSKGGDFKQVYSGTISLGKKIESEVGLQVFPVIGIHPAEFAWLAGDAGIERALETAFEALEIAGRFIREGEAVAIGEVGRPHYPVAEDVWMASNRVLEHAMSIAGDVGCAVQVHSEAASEELFRELKEMAKRNGLPSERVIKHFSGPQVEIANEIGITPSVLASKENLSQINGNPTFLMETDYIDDRTRPGSVLGPKTVPRQTIRLIEEGKITLEEALIIHKDTVERIYGVKLE